MQNIFSKPKSDKFIQLSKVFVVVTLSSLPLLALAQATNFREFAELIVDIVKGFIRILFVSLSVGLAYGVLMYFVHADDAKARENIRGYLLWGIIGISVVFGLWGILEILSTTMGWGNVGIPLIRPPV